MNEEDPLSSVFLDIQSAIGEQRTDDALTLCKRMLRESRRIHGPRHLKHAWALNTLGELHTMVGDYELAEQFLTQALEIRTSESAPDSLDRGESIYSLARLYMPLGRLPEARDLVGQARSIFASALSEDHEYVGLCDRDLVVLEEALSGSADQSPASLVTAEQLEKELLRQAEGQPHYEALTPENTSPEEWEKIQKRYAKLSEQLGDLDDK